MNAPTMAAIIYNRVLVFDFYVVLLVAPLPPPNRQKQEILTIAGL